MKISYKITFIDSYSSLSNFVDNLSEGLHSEKCADRKSHLDYVFVKDDQ